MSLCTTVNSSYNSKPNQRQYLRVGRDSDRPGWWTVRSDLSLPGMVISSWGSGGGWHTESNSICTDGANDAPPAFSGLSLTGNRNKGEWILSKHSSIQLVRLQNTYSSHTFRGSKIQANKGWWHVNIHRAWYYVWKDLTAEFRCLDRNPVLSAVYSVSNATHTFSYTVTCILVESMSNVVWCY